MSTYSIDLCIFVRRLKGPCCDLLSHARIYQAQTHCWSRSVRDSITRYLLCAYPFLIPCISVWYPIESQHNLCAIYVNNSFMRENIVWLVCAPRSYSSWSFHLGRYGIVAESWFYRIKRRFLYRSLNISIVAQTVLRCK